MGRPDESPDLSGNVAFNLGVGPRPVPMPNMQDPAIYLDFFARTLDSAIGRHPNLSRHPLAAAARPNGKRQAREWIQGLVRDKVSNPKWFHKNARQIIFVAQLFSPNYFIALVIAVRPRMWLPRWRTDYPLRGARFRNAEPK